ncbi:MAG: arabinofuranosyltransferase [candidate division Zixibacteria bacterium]|nr:arabinofuranosyltransferase [candidate division Zixibacteria bacterium]
MKQTKLSQAITCLFLVIAFCFIGLLLAKHCHQSPVTSQELRIYGYMGLDFWNLLFVFTVILLWVIPVNLSPKRIAMLSVLGLYGAIALVLVFTPSLFPDNAFWGDQKFRMAMVERFSTSGWPIDYYYKGLPIFYPPVYYWVLGLLGKLTAHHGFEMLQIGLKLIFICMPFLLYGLWRKIVSPTAALFVTSAVLLIDIGGSFMLVAVPHAFIANSLFVPWWLHYIQGIGCGPHFKWSHWVTGSILGTLLLTTYFYPFILLVFMLVVCTLLVIFRSGKMVWPIGGLRQAWLQIFGVAIVSAPYWLPNFLSIIRYGMDRSRGDWYHSGSGGLGFPFLEFNWVGLTGLAAILFALWRIRSRILRSLVWLLALCLGFFLLGSLLGTVDISLNLTKDREFTWAIMTSLIGLAIFSGVQWVRRRYAFIPAYAFINVNEHYAHPASRFALRYDFLCHLTGISDARILNVAMRNNLFDAVDYFMPERQGESLHVQVALSNYPNGLILKDLSFPVSLMTDSAGFVQLPGKNLFEVRPNVSSIPIVKIDARDRRDSLIQLSHIAAIEDRLQPVGRDIIERSLPNGLPRCVRCLDATHPYWFDQRVLLIDCHTFSFADSVYLVASFRINRPIPIPRRVYLHVYSGKNRSQMGNFDFPAEVNSGRWQMGDVVTLCRAFPNPKDSFGFVLGLFDDQGPQGKSFSRVVDLE